MFQIYRKRDDEDRLLEVSGLPRFQKEANLDVSVMSVDNPNYNPQNSDPAQIGEKLEENLMAEE